MMMLCAARMCTYDILCATRALASLVTKWIPACDNKLRRAVSHIQSTLSLKLVALVGDCPQDVTVKLFSDADFAPEIWTHTGRPQGCSCSSQGLTHSIPWQVSPRNSRALPTVVLQQSYLWPSWRSERRASGSSDLGQDTGSGGQLDFEEDDNQAAMRIIESAGPTRFAEWRRLTAWAWRGSMSKCSPAPLSFATAIRKCWLLTIHKGVHERREEVECMQVYRPHYPDR